MYKCEYCNGNLDPGERCDCKERRIEENKPRLREKAYYPKDFIDTSASQLTFNFKEISKWN